MLRLIAPLELFHISGSGERKVEERADEEDKMKKEEKKKEMLIAYKRKKC